MKTTGYLMMAFLWVLVPLRAQTFEWAKAFGGTNYDNGYALRIDASGNIYTGGNFYGTADFDPGTGTYNLIAAGQQDIFVQKTDPSGNFLWARAIGGANNDMLGAIDIDSLGNVYTTGYFLDTLDADPGPGTHSLVSAGDNDIFVQKMDASGRFLWAYSIGGHGDDRVYDLKIDGSGNIYTVGIFGDTVDFDPGPSSYNLIANGYYDAFVQKTDSAGHFLWARAFGGPGYIDAWSLDIDEEGNIYITGSFDGTADFDPGPGSYNLTSAGQYDAYVLKLDSAGHFLWARAFGGTDYDDAWAIRAGDGGNIYTTGDFGATVDFDPGPGTYNLTALGNYDVFVQKMDSAGNFLWAKSFGSNNWDQGNAIEVDRYGNVYTYGIFSDTTDFDPGPGTYQLVPENWSDVFVQKMDSAGNFQWAVSWGGSYFGYSQALKTDNAGNIYTIGNFADTTDFDPGPAVFNLISAGGTDVFVLKLSQPNFRRADSPFARQIRLFPNPARNFLGIRLVKTIPVINLSIADMTGKILRQQKFVHQNTLIIPVSVLRSGIYFVKLQAENRQAILKFIKE